MSTILNRLTAKQVKDATGPKRLADGGGLYLQVTKSGSKSWLFLYRWNEKRPEIGLGSYPAVSLASARRKAEEGRSYLSAKPKVNPRDKWSVLDKETDRAISFGEFAEQFLAGILHTFRNEKHRYQWGQSLRTYAAPIWSANIAEVDTGGVLKCLQPIWVSKHETATRLRGRLERILDAAKAKELRSGENPARWRGHLAAILPRVKHAPVHQAALPYEDLPGFMQKLSENTSMAARVLTFLILTGARSTEARGAMWSEMDMDAGLWVLPARRMKAKKQHRVPLSKSAMKVLEDLKPHLGSDYVFPGQRFNRPLSETSVRKLLLRMHVPLVRVSGADGDLMKPITQHGFRSTFRDWAGDRTGFSREVAELSLAHTVGNAVERSYRRGDALDKRQDLMEQWAEYCMPPI